MQRQSPKIHLWEGCPLYLSKQNEQSFSKEKHDLFSDLVLLLVPKLKNPPIDLSEGTSTGPVKRKDVRDFSSSMMKAGVTLQGRISSTWSLCRL